MIVFEIFGIVFIVMVTAKGVITYKQNKEYNKNLNNKNIRNMSIDSEYRDSDISLSRALNKKTEYTGYPTKEEYEENVRKINERELNSARFKMVKEFISLLNKRENLDLEKRLFKIIGTYGLEDDLINKNYDYKKTSKSKRYNELKKFMNSLTPEQIHSNLYLTSTAEFMNTSITDCKNIIEHLQNQIRDLQISDENRRFEINVDIPKERLDLLPISICGMTSIPYYRPQDYRKEYVYLLDKDNRYIYDEYNKYVRNIQKLAEDIYHLQMWNLLSIYPEQINNYYFNIHNNEFEHQFRTAFFVKKCRESVVEEKSEPYQLIEKTKNNISRIFGLPFDEIVNMDYEELEKYIEQKIGKKPTYDLRMMIDVIPMDEDHIITIEQVDEQIDKITSSPKLVLKMKRKNKENQENVEN